MNLSEKISDLRKKQGWSQEDLADKLGVSRQSVSKWEGGLAMPELDKVVQMSKLFGVSCDYLLVDSANDKSVANSEESRNEEPQTAFASDVSAEQEGAQTETEQLVSVPSKGEKIVMLISSLIWTLGITGYFVWSVFFDGWDKSWVTFIVLAMLQAASVCVSKLAFKRKTVGKNQYEAERKELERRHKDKIGAIFAVYWLVVVVGYSLWSLFANAWAYSWIVFPSAAMFCWTIASILQLVGWQVADSDKID